MYGLFGLEVSCFYFTARRMVKDGVSIALRFVAGMRDAGMRGQGGRKCDGVAEESESRETLKWQKISFEKALESTRKLKNVMERGDIMGIIYGCFRECTNSLAVYFLTAECGFTKPIKEALGRRRQGQGRDAEMERHKEEKELMNLLRLQGFSQEEQR